jgi:hypothetical protein
LAKPGEEYLGRAEGPDPPIPRQGNISVTQELVDRVIAAGGKLKLPGKDWRDPDSIDYTRRARLAEQHDKVPAGKRLIVRNTREGDIEIELAALPVRPGSGVAPKPIEVPNRVTRYHPVAKAFRDQKDKHEVSREALQRATRIVHVICKEAEGRGWKPAAPTKSPDKYERETWTPAKDGHFVIDAGPERFWFRMREGQVKLRGSWESEVERFRNVDPNSSWYRDRTLPGGPYDANADGELDLELHCEQRYSFQGHQSFWGDRKSWTLEKCLTDLLQELEMRTAEAALREKEAEEAAIEAKRQAEEAAKQRDVDWKAHLKEAWRRLNEARRADGLRSQAAAWAESRALASYCEAVESAHGDDPGAREWLEWARGFIEDLDPLDAPPSLPEITEAPQDELQQYMPEGWSIRGAEYSDPREIRRPFRG